MYHNKGGGPNQPSEVRAGGACDKTEYHKPVHHNTAHGSVPSQVLRLRVIHLTVIITIMWFAVSVFQLGIFLRALRPARTGLRPARFTSALPELFKKKTKK